MEPEGAEELLLPEGLNPDAIRCCLHPDRKLRVQARRTLKEKETRRELSIRRMTEEKLEEGVCVLTHTRTQRTENKTWTFSIYSMMKVHKCWINI